MSRTGIIAFWFAFELTARKRQPHDTLRNVLSERVRHVFAAVISRLPVDSAPKPRMSSSGKGPTMHRFGYAIAALIAPAFAAGRVRSFSIFSKTMAKTTTKTV